MVKAMENSGGPKEEAVIISDVENEVGRSIR
jgi:hypothetical protein